MVFVHSCIHIVRFVNHDLIPQESLWYKAWLKTRSSVCKLAKYTSFPFHLHNKDCTTSLTNILTTASQYNPQQNINLLSLCCISMRIAQAVRQHLSLNIIYLSNLLSGTKSLIWNRIQLYQASAPPPSKYNHYS